MTTGDCLIPFVSKWLADGKRANDTSDDKVADDYCHDSPGGDANSVINEDSEVEDQDRDLGKCDSDHIKKFGRCF